MSHAAGYTFGGFEVDLAAGELRRHGLRVRLHRQPFELLCLLLARPGEVVTREEIARALWPEGTFVDFDHGVNAAVGRLREALRDQASAPRFIETLPRRGYRFLSPVKVVGNAVSGEGADLPTEQALRSGQPQAVSSSMGTGGQHPGQSAALQGSAAAAPRGAWLTTPEVLPRLPGQGARVSFLLLEAMYLSFSVAILANLPQVQELIEPLRGGQALFTGTVALAACTIPLRLYLAGLAMLRPPWAVSRFLRVWPLVLGLDGLAALSPLLLVHHLSFGLALACICPLVYAPFAERSLVLMGAAGEVE